VLKDRVITGAIGIPVIVLAVWFGDPWFSIFVALAALAGTYEFYRMAGLQRAEPLMYLGLLWSLALVLSCHYLRCDVLPLVVGVAMLVSLICLLPRPSRETAFRSWAWTIAGAFYVGWMLSYWLNLRGLADGRNWVYLAMFTTFANDTGAYFVGRAMGRRKLAPAISAAKTWEGAIGGLVSAVVAAVVIATILGRVNQGFSDTSPCTFQYWEIMVVGLVVSIFAQLGDLVESLLKRNMGVKESGKLLPGHGGVLDRFDSLIFVGAAVYYYVTWVLL